MKDLLIVAIIWLRGFNLKTKKDNLKKVKPTKLQGYATGNFGCDGTIEYLETKKYIGFQKVTICYSH